MHKPYALQPILLRRAAAALQVICICSIGYSACARSSEVDLYPQKPYDPAGRQVLESASSWFSTNMHPFTGHLSAAEQIAPLLSAIGSARVIALGELSHGDLESTLTRLNILKGLVEQGSIRHIGIEAPISGGVQLDRFVREKESHPHEELLKKAERTLLTSSLYDIWHTTHFRDFLIWLRVHNQKSTSPVGIFGFDFGDAANETRMLLGFLKKVERSRPSKVLTQELQSIEATLAPLLSVSSDGALTEQYLSKLSPNSLKPQRKALSQLVALFRKYAARVGPTSDSLHLSMAARSLEAFTERSLMRQAGKSLEDLAKEAFASNTNNSGFRNRFSQRDTTMAELIKLRVNSTPATRVAILAHNNHVERNGMDGQDFASFAITLGRVLQIAYEDEYVVINFVTASGRFAASYTADHLGKMQSRLISAPIGPNPFSLGAFYERLGVDRFWVDLRTLPGIQPWAVAWRSYPFISLTPGNTWLPHLRFFPNAVPVGGGTDITVFFRCVHPVTRIQTPKSDSARSEDSNPMPVQSDALEIAAGSQNQDCPYLSP